MTPPQTPAQDIPAFIRENRAQCCFGAASDDQCPAQAVFRSKRSPRLCWCEEHASDFKPDALDLIEIPEAGGGDWAEEAAGMIDGAIRHHLTDLLDDDRVKAIATIIRKHAPEPQPPGTWGAYTLAKNGWYTLKPQRAEEPKELEIFGMKVRVDESLPPNTMRIEVPRSPSVATPLPEGVPALDGEFADFEYSGTKRLVGVPSCGSPDIILFDDIEGWMKNYCGEWWDGSDDISHKAIRRGTELHRLNFTPASDLQHALQGGLEAAGNAAAKGDGFRYFKDANGDRWKMPTVGLGGFVMIRGNSQWSPMLVPMSVQGLLNRRTVRRDGTIETAADGTPLEGGGA
jgi:hypothetical protein